MNPGLFALLITAGGFSAVVLLDALIVWIAKRKFKRKS
jgi:hypothetical protein